MMLQGGGYAEYAVATPRQCLNLPATTAALVEPPAVALHGVMLSGLQPGARVLILGAGPIVMLGLCTAEDGFVFFRAVSKEVRLIASAFFTMREYHTALDVLDGRRRRVSAKALVTDTVTLSAMLAVFEALCHRTTQGKATVRPG